MHAVLGVLATALLQAAPPPPSPGAAAVASKILSSAHEQLICPQERPVPNLVVATKKARYILWRSGQFDIETDGESLVQFTSPSREGDFQAVALVEEVRGDELFPVACGLIESNKPYELPNLEAVGKNNPIVVSLFGPPRTDAEKKRAEQIAKARREDLLKELAPLEQRQLRFKAGLPKLQEAIDTYVVSQEGKERGEAWQKVEAAEGVTRKYLDGIRQTSSCGSTPHSPFGPLLCEEYEKLITELAFLRAAVDEKKPLLIKDADLLKLKAAARAKGVTDEEKKPHCETVEQLNWNGQSDLRLLSQAQVPSPRSQNTYAIEYGQGYEAFDHVPAKEPLGVVVLRVPVGRQISTGTKYDKVLTEDLGVVLSKFLPKLLPALGLVKMEAAPPVVVKSLVCPEAEVAVDTKALPLAATGTRAFYVPELKGDRVLEAQVCEGAACGAQAEAKALRNRVQFTPRRQASFTLLAALTASPSSTGTLSQPRWETLPGAVGPDQLFQLSQRTEFSDRFSTALLLGVRLDQVGCVDRFLWSDTLLLAGGPSLLVGTGKGVFKQWNLMAGLALTESVYVTAGYSYRSVPTPLDYQEGERLAVARPAGGGDASAPALRTRDAGRGLFSLGLALDLSVLGDAAESLTKSIGGK